MSTGQRAGLLATNYNTRRDSHLSLPCIFILLHLWEEVTYADIFCVEERRAHAVILTGQDLPMQTFQLSVEVEPRDVQPVDVCLIPVQDRLFYGPDDL